MTAEDPTTEEHGVRHEMRPGARPFARGTRELEPCPAEPPPHALEELAEIVHDLKAPLGTIALEVTMLDLQEGAVAIATLRPVLERILRNVAYVDRMVMNLLDTWTSAPARGSTDTIGLRALIAAVIERAVPTGDRARIALVAPHEVVVRADELELQRVVGNLLSNAIKYAPPRSAIVVRIDAHDQRCCVSVIDCGPGVSEAEAAYIFDRYRRTPASRAREGVGIGLYACRKIIEAHGGTLGVERLPTIGSRFYFELATA